MHRGEPNSATGRHRHGPRIRSTRAGTSALLAVALVACSGTGGGSGDDGTVDGTGGASGMHDGGTGAADASPPPGGGGGAHAADDAAMPDSGPTGDAGVDGGQGGDAGPDAGPMGTACEDPVLVRRDGHCVPRCQPLPGSYQAAIDPPDAPLFDSSVWLDPDIITEEDPSSFVDLVYRGTGARAMYDFRVVTSVMVQAHLFDARFGSGLEIEVQVNPEIAQQDADAEARHYALAIGRLPAFLFSHLQSVGLHRGAEVVGGVDRSLIIHTGQHEIYEVDGVLEEVLLHEATHVSMDAHEAAADWLAAQAADGVAISPFATAFPVREDFAETLGPYLAATFRPARLQAGVADALRDALPNRFKYLDCLGLSMRPPR